MIIFINLIAVNMAILLISLYILLIMNIEHLRLFIRVAAINNISQAGRELGLSAAVSSTYINKLEQSLGVRLVHRTTRSVSLTEEGIAFLPHAEEVLASVETAQASVGTGSVTPRGTLRVAASASFGRMHIIPALPGFLQRFPDLKVDLRLSDAVLDLVEGGFDVAVRNSSLNDSTLIARRLAHDIRILCAAPQYLETNGEPATPEELVDHSCISLMGLESWAFEMQKGVQQIKIKSLLRTDNGEAVRDACVGGIGITICSVWCAYQELRSGELVQVLKDYPLASQTSVWALYPSSRLLAPKVRAFIDYFIEHFGETPYWEEGIQTVPSALDRTQ